LSEHFRPWLNTNEFLGRIPPLNASIVNPPSFRWSDAIVSYNLVSIVAHSLDNLYRLKVMCSNSSSKNSVRYELFSCVFSVIADTLEQYRAGQW
jgi:hypothetical protein